ncbi:GILT-like protein 1 isoform X1 [Coccinella septempunctata]|uniref:GILT-like protein 1 isoform X1 n=1 Tax=Coccinella septempunctata TaxID=41139 RepID=UPI001D06C96E|nr:GILT-like protein 1 isoform X1 [Coccinella septempunctata]
MKSTNKSLHIILIVTVTNVVCSDNRLKVSVYYESLCPYSIDFIKTKIFPHYKEFQNYVRLEWIPYGKANQTLINGKWSFKCQHGRDECKSNMYQACGLDQGRSQERNIEFINCVVSLINPAYTRGIEYCARANTFDWESMESCFRDGTGDDLLAKMGKKTSNLGSKFKHVPTVVFNDDFDPLLCEYALENFVKATCSKIIGEKPKIC